MNIYQFYWLDDHEKVMSFFILDCHDVTVRGLRPTKWQVGGGFLVIVGFLILPFCQLWQFQRLNITEVAISSEEETDSFSSP